MKIGVASGEFESITGLTSETDSIYGDGNYSLQLNSNTFTTSTTYTDNKKTTGWEQFVYSNGSTEDATGSHIIWADAFIEYWLIGYHKAYGKCPSTNPPFVPLGTGWIPYDSDCYADSEAAGFLSVGYIPPAYLGGAYLIGSSNFWTEASWPKPEDEVDFCYQAPGEEPGELVPICVTVVVAASILDLFKYWSESEFNVYGFGGGSEAQFNSGTLIQISNALKAQDGTDITPKCVTNTTPGSSLTGESNNLRLGDYCGVNWNEIVFKEGNLPPDSENVMVSYSTPGGAGTSEPPTFNYVSLGDPVALTLKTTVQKLYVDPGTSWFVTPSDGLLPCTSCDIKHERWMSPPTQALTGTVPTGGLGVAFAVFQFYHQYRQSVSYTILPASGPGSPTPPTWTSNQFGGSTSQPIEYCPSWAGVYCILPPEDWSDNGSAWSVPNPLVGSTSSEQWVTLMSTKGTVSSPQTVTFKYHHQFNLTTSVYPSTAYGVILPALFPSGSAWEDYQSSLSFTAKPNPGYSFYYWSTPPYKYLAGHFLCAGGNSTSCNFKMPAHALTLVATFSYTATFKQVGIPSGILWGVTVGETRYTSKTSTVTVPGLSGTVNYWYDTSVPVPKGGGSYTCVLGCGGSVSAPTTVTATYQPQLDVTPVSPPSPPNGARATSENVTLEVRVTGPGGSPVSKAMVYVVYWPGTYSGTSYWCSGLSDSKGYFSCLIDTYKGFEIPSIFHWYAVASEVGYATGESPIWTFTSYAS
jgi:hypothetical protein